MDIKIITIQVAHSTNRTIGYGYDVSLYESEDAMFDNMAQEFASGFPDTVEFASLVYKLNNGYVGTILMDTELSGEELVDSIKQGFVS